MADAMIRIKIVSAGMSGISTVGMPATLSCNAPYTMKLPKHCPLYIIRHEFLHALGFLHDHQSPRRPFSINIAVPHDILVSEAMKTFEISRKLAEGEIENQYSFEDVGICTRYDVTSVSHYRLPRSVMVKRSFFKRIPASQPNLQFSDLDKAVLVLMYPRATPHAATPEWTVEHALSVVGVPKRLQGAIIGDRSPDGIQTRFVEWNQTTHSSSHCVIM